MVENVWQWLGLVTAVAAILGVGWVTFRNQATKAGEEAREETLRLVTEHRDELIALTNRQTVEIEKLKQRDLEKSRQIDLLTQLVTKSADIENLAVMIRGYHQEQLTMLHDLKGLMGGQRDGEPASA